MPKRIWQLGPLHYTLDLLRTSGLPMPLFNTTVFAGDAFVARPDAWWPEFGVVVEGAQ